MLLFSHSQSTSIKIRTNSYRLKPNYQELGPLIIKIQLSKDGQKFLIFPNWNIKVKPVYVTLTVNKKNAQIKENTTKIAVSNTTHFSKKIGPLVPGSYQLSSSANLNGHKLTNANTYHLNSNRTIPLTLKTVSFKVSGPAGTHVKINSKDQGKLAVVV